MLKYTVGSVDVSPLHAARSPTTSRAGTSLKDNRIVGLSARATLNLKDARRSRADERKTGLRNLSLTTPVWCRKMMPMKDATATSPALPPPPVQEIEAGNGFAVAALVFGIASLFIVFALFTGAAAIAIGSVGLYRANRGAGRQALAIWGIALGGAGLALYFFLNFFPILFSQFN